MNPDSGDSPATKDAGLRPDGGHLSSPSALVCYTSTLGWSTYGNEVGDAVCNRDVAMKDLMPGYLGRVLIHRYRILGNRQPIDASLLLSRRLANVRRSFPGAPLHVGPHEAALALKRDPFTVALDTTRRQWYREGFNLEPNRRRRFNRDAGILKRARVLFPWTKWCADSLMSDYDVPAGKIEVTLPSIVNSGRFEEPQRPEIPRLLFIGNAFARKGGPFLLRAHREGAFGKAELRIVSSHCPEVRAAGVTVARGLTREEIAREMARSTVLVFPTYKDTAGFVLVEALFAGLPTAVFAVGGTGELCRHGVTGLVVERGDEAGFASAVRGLVADSTRLNDFASASRPIAEAFHNGAQNYGAVLDATAELA